LNEVVYRSKHRYRLISSDIVSLIKKNNLKPFLFHIKRDAFFDVFNELKENIRHRLSGKINDYTSTLEVNKLKYFENGSKGLDVRTDRSFYILKMHKLLTDPPTKFIVPTTVRLDKNRGWVTHPGTTKIPLSQFFSKELIIKVLMFKNRNKQEDNKISKLMVSSEEIYELHDFNVEEIYNVFDFNTYLGNSIALNIHKNFFEVSEYHQDIPNFTDKEYTLKLTNTELFVNDQVFCYLSSDNIWDFCKMDK